MQTLQHSPSLFFYAVLIWILALSKVWPEGVYRIRSGLRCVKYCLIVDVGQFLFLHLNCLVKCSLMLHQYSDAHEFLCTTNIFNHFSLLQLLKLQYQMKGGEKLPSINYWTSVSSPSSSKCQPMLERCPIRT